MDASRPLLPPAHEPDERLLESWRYLQGIPGKDVRRKLISAFQEWLHVPEEKLANIAEIVANLHEASLLVDDIEDGSTTRRGHAAAHIKFGVPLTLNAANYVYFLALEKAFLLDNPAAMSMFVQETLNLHRGQGHDILWRETHQCPTEEEYKQMVLDKTGGLFRLAVGMMQAHSSSTLNLTPLVNDFALYFQIRDDYINLTSSEYMDTKHMFCEDLTEGKFSFPIVHCVLSNPADTRLLDTLKLRTADDAVKRQALQVIIDAGSLEYTRRVLQDIHDRIMRHLDELGGNAYLLTMLRALHQSITTPGSDVALPSPERVSRGDGAAREGDTEST